MRIRLLRNTVCDRRQVFAGDTIDASEYAAKTLILMGKAIASSAKSKAKKKAKPTAGGDD